MRGKRILITGAAGSVGSELLKQLAPYNVILGIDIDETGIFYLYNEQKELNNKVKSRVGDIRNKDTLKEIFTDFKPQIVFHAAAYKHVTPMELTPREAVENNVLGTINLVEVSKRHGVEKFVFISTDKAVNVNSIMGTTKRLGELIVKNAGYISVRFANVLGSRGSVIPIWQKQIDEGRPLTITHPRMKRYFMTIENACDLVIKASEMGKGGEIFVLDMGDEVNILNLAKQIIKKSQKKVQIEITGTRPGETIKEKIMFENERRVAIKKEGIYIIK